MGDPTPSSARIGDLSRPRARGRSLAGVVVGNLLRGSIYLLLILGTVVSLFPFLFMVSASLKTQSEMFALPPNLIPTGLRLENYAGLLVKTKFLLWYGNSLVVTVARLVLSLFLCSLAGFAFAKYEFPLKRGLFIVLIGSMMIPFQVVLVPLFIVMVRFGWLNTYYALIIPWAASAFGIFLMRQYMMSVPGELLDAARIDGASEFGLYWMITLPLSLPALGALGIVIFMSSWTSFLWPLVVINKAGMYTLPLGLANFLSDLERETLWGYQMAAGFLVTLPIFIIFLVMQKQFIAGLTLGSVKG